MGQILHVHWNDHKNGYTGTGNGGIREGEKATNCVAGGIQISKSGTEDKTIR